MEKKESQKYIKNALRNSGSVSSFMLPSTNAPLQYDSRQRQYYAERTSAFIASRSKYASDFVEAQVQGIFEDDFYRYVNTCIRFADVASQSASASKNVDDVKVVLFAEEKIDYFPIGAKIETMGSTWICTNPSNISSVHTTALVQRCNASYCLYDYYGNIVTEPIIIDKNVMLSTDNSSPQNLVLMDGYFNVTCQLNENTKQLDQNQRILLGTKAYHITGFTDFIQEFTGDYESVHLLKFTIRIEEPTENDDIENHIANGKQYTFNAEISGVGEIAVGASLNLKAHFIKNGQEVLATSEYPVTWDWETSDKEVAEVTQDGVVVGKSSGACQITAAMRENSAIVAIADLVVEDGKQEPYTAFYGAIPKSIQQYRTATIEAGYYENGILTQEAITWEFSGANKRCYSVKQTGNKIQITATRASNEPLVITASCNGTSTKAEIALDAY